MHASFVCTERSIHTSLLCFTWIFLSYIIIYVYCKMYSAGVCVLFLGGLLLLAAFCIGLALKKKIILLSVNVEMLK